jgi:hypothetical protein
MHFLFLFILYPYWIISDIIETDTFQTLFSYVTPHTLIVCDLDNTLIAPLSHVGSVQWGYHTYRQFLCEGLSAEEAEQAIHALWMKVQPLITIGLVEDQSADILSHIQQRGIQVIGLTSRYIEEAFYTQKQIQSVNIAFNQIHCCLPYYMNGILYCGRQSKSSVLNAFLKVTQLQPHHLIFIDDTWHHVYDIAATLKDQCIEHTCIRFSRADNQVAHFDPHQAAIELAHLVDSQLQFLPLPNEPLDPHPNSIACE